MQGWQYRDFCGDLCFRNAHTLAPVDVLQCQHVSVCVCAPFLQMCIWEGNEGCVRRAAF